MPIQKARGAINPTAPTILTGSGQGKAHWNKVGNTNR